MAAVTVAAQNTRVNDAVSTTGWVNINGGGGIAAEPDIVYQGTGAQSRKVSGTELGRGYDPGTGAVDMTVSNRRAWLAKIQATNKNALNARGATAMKLRIGSSNANHYTYNVFGNDNYPAVGGFQLIAIDPNVSGYRDATTGTPVLTAVDYFGVLATFSATSKSENVVIDAIDIGAGLTLVGGDGGDPDGTFASFLAADEGTTSNRWGYVSSREGIIYVNGGLVVGENTAGTAVATAFSSVAGRVIVWNNGWFATGFALCRFNLGSASTSVLLTGNTFIGRGEKNNTVGLGYTTTEDTRPQFNVVGTSGTMTVDGCTLLNFSSLTLTSVVIVTGCTIQCETLTQAGASIVDSVIQTTSLTTVATIAAPTFGTTTGLRDTEFVQKGAGHALEISAAGTYNLQGLIFTGYGANASNSAAIYVSAASGTVTINISGGGSTPTFRTAGATVVINNTVTVRVTAKDAVTAAAIQNARVYVEAAAGGNLPASAVVSITRSGSVATVTHTSHGLATGQKVKIRGCAENEYNILATITVTGVSSYTYAISGTPATPATGAPRCTAVVLDGLSDVSGIVEDAGFNYTANQPVVGNVRRGTTSPLYKPGLVSGTVTINGFDQSAFLVSDE